MKQAALMRHLPGGLREPSRADCCDSSCLQTCARQTRAHRTFLGPWLAALDNGGHNTSPVESSLAWG